ncbi:TPA: phage tail protein [Escherichia coli]|nr:phage tail protein [Escherichia coli]
MGLNVASVKSYVSSALTTTLFGSGVGEREVGKLTSIIMNKMLFAQGWQFSVEVDGLEGADFFAKDITYHDYSIEYETIKIGGGNILQPTERSPGQITMMVRDTVDGLVLDWFKTAKSRVINPDGTGNIPSKYLLNVRIYRLLSSGLTKLENEMTVFPVTTGDVTYARDQVEAMLLQKLTVDLPDIPISGLSVAEGDAFDKLKISIRIRDITITQDVVL